MARRGFTLVELLVVLAVTAVLLGLLLPAVQKVRAAAARASCANNLKQLALAAHNFHGATGRFPPGRGAPAPRIFSAHAYLLPYLEQGNVDATIDYTAAPATYTAPGIVYDGSVNRPAASTAVRAFLCPADGSGGRVPSLDFAGTNYPANSGSGTALAGANGVFFAASAVRISDIADGTSNTALFAERPLGNGSYGFDPRLSMIELPGSTEPTAAACGGGPLNNERGGKWIVGNFGNTLYNHLERPDAAADCTNATQQKGRLAARSLHAGGVNIATADGGVRFVARGVELPYWQALGTRAGGEPAGP